MSCGVYMFSILRRIVGDTRSMIPAFNYREVCETISRRGYDGIRMVGLLFARATSPLAKAEIIDNLDYFHYRSGEHIDFFCGGYGAYWEGRRDEFPDQQVVARGQYSNWLYSARRFNEFRQEIEAQTTWRYSGGADLILANAHSDPHGRNTRIDFACTVLCQLDQMKQDGAILSVETFFEQIFQFTESCKVGGPTWGFSAAKGIRSAGSVLKNLVLSLLPKELGDDVKRTMHFAVKDIGKAG